MRRATVLSLISLLAFGSGAMAGYNTEQERASASRSVQTSNNSFLGVELADVSRETVQRLKLGQEQGALIEAITPESSAAQAGLRKDDVVVKWNGERIEGSRELSRRIRETPPGRNVRLGVIREGREIEVDVKLGARQASLTRPRIVSATPEARAQLRAEAARARNVARAEMARQRDAQRAIAAKVREEARATAAAMRDQMRSTARLGVQVQSMTPQLAEYFGLSKRTGSLVVFVYADSAAAKAGLKAGDVILSAGGQTVESPMDLRRVLYAKPEGALELRILRDKQEQTVTVQIEKSSGSLLVDGGDCDSIVHAAIAPMTIHVPAIALPAIRVETPRLTVAPMKVEVPGVITPITITPVHIDLKPIKVTVPMIKIDPINLVVVPRRVVL